MTLDAEDLEELDTSKKNSEIQQQLEEVKDEDNDDFKYDKALYAEGADDDEDIDFD